MPVERDLLKEYVLITDPSCQALNSLQGNKNCCLGADSPVIYGLEVKLKGFKDIRLLKHAFPSVFSSMLFHFRWFALTFLACFLSGISIENLQ